MADLVVPGSRVWRPKNNSGFERRSDQLQNNCRNWSGRLAAGRIAEAIGTSQTLHPTLLFGNTMQLTSDTQEVPALSEENSVLPAPA